MLFVDSNNKFKITHQPFLAPQSNDFLFCYKNNEIGLLEQNEIPLVQNLLSDFTNLNLYCFGNIEKQNCFLAPENISKQKLNFKKTRSIVSSLPEKFHQAAVIGNYLDHWRTINTYCGQCGANLQDSLKERARICTECNNIIYPRISPCVLVLVTHGEKILLARSPHFPEGVLSVLAGFIDLGETVEHAIKREVQEEVDLEVHNLKYIASQPWLFPDSLLLGFTAEYVAGNISIDKNEIEFADWFDKDNLPKQLPDPMSLSRYLIERHLKK